jgi:hypothetical protein
MFGRVRDLEILCDSRVEHGAERVLGAPCGEEDDCVEIVVVRRVVLFVVRHECGVPADPWASDDVAIEEAGVFQQGIAAKRPPMESPT